MRARACNIKVSGKRSKLDRYRIKEFEKVGRKKKLKKSCFHAYYGYNVGEVVKYRRRVLIGKR